MQAVSAKAPSQVALVPVGKAIAATVIMGLCVAIFPVAPTVIIPFLALPLAHVVARWGLWSGMIVALAAGALIYAGVGVSGALLVFLLTLGVGATSGWAVRKGWRFGRSFGWTAVGAFAALVLWGLIIWLGFGVDFTWLKEMAYGSIDDVAAQYTAWGMSAASVETASAQLRDMVDAVPYLAPGLLGMVAILLAACSLGLSYLIFPRLRQKVAVAWSLSGFRMHWAVAYVSIAGLAMVLFARADGRWSTVVMYVGINLLLVSQTLFFVQGLAVVRWLTVARHWARGSRIALFVAAVLGQVLFQLTGLVGLFDTWVDFRKRFALKSTGTGSTGDFHKE
jgi:uncharacterized protein YybS (DUF2232 family)